MSRKERRLEDVTQPLELNWADGIGSTHCYPGSGAGWNVPTQA